MTCYCSTYIKNQTEVIMRVSICSAIFILAIFNVRESSAATDKVICYYGSWSTYRSGKGKFDVENIDPKLCTHLIYTFVGLLPDATIRVLDEYNDLEENWGKGGFKRFNKLKQLNPKLKTMIAIGGFNEGSVTYSNVMASDTLREKFVQNVVAFVTKYNFDGFDLDWEYPAQRGGASYDVSNFSKLIQELRAVFDPHRLLLSAAVAAAEFSVSQSYDVPELSK
ncbi:Chitinase 8 [Carabus blaptoides fortunei]